MNFGNGEAKSVNKVLLVEKYRPKTVDDLVGNDELKSRIRGFIDEQDIPHLLFYGKPGTGKTSVAKLIIDSIDCDSMIINASEENNVETVRNKIKSFATSVGFKSLKIMVLDEGDYLTPSAQAILRNLMETYSNYCRFIITCNYEEKIIDAIKSRTESYKFLPPSKKQVAIHVGNILKTEGIKFDPKELVHLVFSYYPDIRRTLNACNSKIVSGELKVNLKEIIENDYKQKIVEILKGKDSVKDKYNAMRSTIINSNVNDYSELFTFLYEQVGEFAPGNSANVILTLAEGQQRHSQSIDKEIAITATLIEILNLLQ